MRAFPVVVALLLLVAAGCAAGPLASAPPVAEASVTATPAAGQASPAGDLAAARARWRRLDLSTYRYRLELSCFCGGPETTGPFVVEVVDGAVRSADHELIEGAGMQDAPTVERLFDQIEGFLDDGAALAGRYDDTTGLPQRLLVDVIPRVEHVDGTVSETVDDEVTYSAELIAPAGPEIR